VRALLTFFTVLPLPGGTLQDAARAAYLLPLVGVVTGLPGALILLSELFPAGVAATLALVASIFMAGLHHADGVLDVGDALMVRGSPRRRREVLKDARVGVGGLGALFLIYAPAIAALAALANTSPWTAALALLASEISVRSAMTFLLAYGRPADHRSTSVPFVGSLKSGRRRAAAVALAAALPPIVALPLGWGAFPAFFAAPAVALFSLRLSNRAFGGVGGDVVGATGELARVALLVALSAVML
jgi:adenosylcobinamide-GDP ribazoletransferase